jgi:dynein light chain 4
MSQEMGGEAVEVIVGAMDKYQSTKNYEAAALFIKNSMDKRFGLCWHCAIGEGFGFDITCQHRYCLYVFYGVVGIVVYKC